MWHTLILSKWKEFFLWLPIETLIYERQSEYYQALNDANTLGESTSFVEFTLQIIKDALIELINNYKEKDVGINVGINILELIKSTPTLTAKEMALCLNISQRQTERLLAEMKKQGKIQRMGAGKNGYWKVEM